MRILAALPLLAGCDILFQLREVKRDAAPAMEASVDAPARCPFSDTFDDNTISTSWMIYDPTHAAGFTTEKDGAIDIALDGTAGAYNGILSATTHDMTGMVMRATAYPMNEIGYSETFMQIVRDPANYIRMNTGAGDLSLITVVDGTETRATTLYVAAIHRHWRLRHDPVAQLVYFEASGDGITFQILRTVAIPFALDATRLSFIAGTYEAPPPGTILGSARYDDFSVCPP